MLEKTLQPQPIYPTASLTVSNETYTIEVGQSVSPTFSVGLNQGNYKYEGGSNQGATVCAKTDQTVSGVREADLNKASGTVGTFTALDSDNSTTKATVVASVDYGQDTSSFQLTNSLGKAATTSKIGAGTTANVTKYVKITGVRNWFYGVDTDGTETIDSAFIRGLTVGGNCETALNKTTGKRLTAGAGAKRIVIAIPKKNTSTSMQSVNQAKTLTTVYLESASDTPLWPDNADGYKKQAEPVSVNDASGANPINYDVWIYQPASISPTEVHNIVIS